MMKGFRVVGILAMSLAIAHCGGNDVDVSTDAGVVPSPGTFNGVLSDGGAIRLEVGSIEAVAFDCDNERIQETFTPPQPVDSDGTFNVKFSDGGREFRVRGTFRDNNTVDGTIEDEENQCDVSYDANRGLVLPTATPARTPTSVVPTPTPDDSATSTPDSGETATPDGGVTATPGGGGSGATKTATPTVAGSPCPVGVEVIGTAGNAKVLDTGWTGLAQNQTIVQDGKLTFTISSCDSPVRPCGVCDVGGPVQNTNAEKGDINAHRCSNDTTIRCTNDAGCTAPGKCVFYFGAPLPLSAGGVSTCVTNQVNGNVTGTANIEKGSFASNLNLTARVFNGIEQALPCPVCVGDPTLNDGKKQGTCSGGPKNGSPCDGNGRSPVPSFGTTSFDCPPNPGAAITTLTIALNGSSGTEKVTLSATSPNCSDAPGKKCFCIADGQATRPNACIDDTSQAGDGTLCAADSATEGHCTEGPVDQQCAIESFRGCTGNADCPAAGDSCVSVDRPCYLDNGAIGGSVSAIGFADPPSNGVSNPTLAALFCVGKTSAAVNAAAGLPGLGRIELPLLSKELLVLPAP